MHLSQQHPYVCQIDGDACSTETKHRQANAFAFFSKPDHVLFIANTHTKRWVHVRWCKKKWNTKMFTDERFFHPLPSIWLVKGEYMAIGNTMRSGKRHIAYAMRKDILKLEKPSAAYWIWFVLCCCLFNWSHISSRLATQLTECT